MKQVRIAFKAHEFMELDQLKILQGNLKDLSKDNYERFKKQILKSGFAEPITVWIDEKGTAWSLNGTQRIRTLTAMREEGFAIPMLPVNVVEAAGVKEAKEILLSLASQYGEMTMEGLDEFTSDMLDINLNDFRFPEINLKNMFDEDEKKPKGEGRSVECPDCGHNFTL